MNSFPSVVRNGNPVFRYENLFFYPTGRPVPNVKLYLRLKTISLWFFLTGRVLLIVSSDLRKGCLGRDTTDEVQTCRVFLRSNGTPS